MRDASSRAGGRPWAPDHRPPGSRPLTVADVAPGDLRLTWLGHATALIEMDGVRLLTDPLLGDHLGPLQRHGPLPDLSLLGPIDAALVSHAHPDHFDRTSLRRLPGEPLLIVPDGLGATAARLGPAHELAVGRSTTVGGVHITAVEARHGRWPRHPRATTVGYLITGRHRVYFAGDTSKFDGIADLAGAADIALLPIGSWGPHGAPWHLGPTGAAEVAAMLRVANVVPIHWGTFYPAGLHRVWPDPLARPARRFVRRAAELAPDTEVRVLQPGDATSFQ